LPMNPALLHRLLLSWMLLFVPTAVLATAQEPDLLIVDGKTEALYTNPLGAYLEKHPDALPKSGVRSSANWRGYVATFEIADDALVLVKVEQAHYDAEKRERRERRSDDVMNTMFPGRKRVVADWYSGTLLLPQGELVDYVHMGYGSTYSHYRLFVVRSGRVLRDLKLDADGFDAYREARFAAFRKTPEFDKAFAEARAGDRFNEAQALDFIRGFYAERYLSMDSSADEP
jgi:hypothetical protein